MDRVGGRESQTKIPSAEGIEHEGWFFAASVTPAWSCRPTQVQEAYMSTTDRLMRTTLEMAKPVLDKLGIVAAPLRGVYDARRVLTIERPPDEVEQFLADGSHTASTFGSGARPDGTGRGTADPFLWRLDSGRASATVRPSTDGGQGSEVVLDVHLDSVRRGDGVRYADNAGVIAIRALHRIKSHMETGEVATLAGNPAARPDPDPYGD